MLFAFYFYRYYYCYYFLGLNCCRSIIVLSSSSPSACETKQRAETTLIANFFFFFDHDFLVLPKVGDAAAAPLPVCVHVSTPGVSTVPPHAAAEPRASSSLGGWKKVEKTQRAER